MNSSPTLLTFVSALAVAGLIGLSPSIPAASIATAEANPIEPRFGLKLAEPPSLDPGILSMMQTNVAGSIEARVYFVENWQIARGEKAQVFFRMLAEAGAEDQRKLAHAAVGHVANSNYTLVARHLLDTQLPKAVLSVLMTDTLKRDYHLKLPMLLSLAQREKHPMQKEARELLQGYLGKDHGTNWAKWDEAMQTRLKTN